MEAPDGQPSPPAATGGAEDGRERIGLALSGGGFRAAFFHVGVLARLAELEILPRVEVISTVSGGSIVGALYYLCLKRRLDAPPPGGLERDGYLELVGEVESRLRAGVQRNIRGRVFANPLKNATMVLSSRYSRSDRIGDLYDRHLYKGAWRERRPRKWNGHGPERQIELRQLPIEPHGEKIDPKRYNEGRAEKVPILSINATSLNSGHNWRFEAIRMGESLPADAQHERIVAAVDKNMRLEPGYFEPGADPSLVPAAQRDFPLALAVAASAAVPGVFQPLAISDMYPGIRVQLVDGGVQDNQGVQGLFDRGCKRLIVSDASGQMGDLEMPSSHIPGVLGRSASIEGDRIRDEQLIDALSGPYGQLALMHLRKGLDARAVAPEGSPAAKDPGVDACDSIAFGVHPGVQEALSRIRTDLDFFGDDEASALELDGYLMSGLSLREGGFVAADDADAATTAGWAFDDRRLREEVGGGGTRLLRTLRVGKQKFLRPLLLRPALGAVAAIVALLALAVAIWAAWDGIVDLLGGHWPAWLVLLVLVVVAALAVDYAADPRSKAARAALWPVKALLSIPLALLAALAALPVFALVSAAEFFRGGGASGARRRRARTAAGPPPSPPGRRERARPRR
jgi:NTE family protein